MEETQNQNQETQQAPVETPSTPPAESVTFSPLPHTQSGSKLPKVIILVVILIILGVGGYLIFKRGGSSNGTNPTSSPISGGEEGTPVPTATPAPADKSKVSIEVQNGTGIAGEAAYLSDQLKLLGYSNVTVGNAQDQTNTATAVTFIDSISTQVQDEITGKLKGIYQEVQVKTSSTLTTDVLVVSGLRKGQTPLPSATETPAPTETPTETPTESPTATP